MIVISTVALDLNTLGFVVMSKLACGPTSCLSTCDWHYCIGQIHKSTRIKLSTARKTRLWCNSKRSLVGLSSKRVTVGGSNWKCYKSTRENASNICHWTFIKKNENSIAKNTIYFSKKVKIHENIWNHWSEHFDYGSNTNNKQTSLICFGLVHSISLDEIHWKYNSLWEVERLMCHYGTFRIINTTHQNRNSVIWNDW